MRYILTLITLFACNYSYAENIALQCKLSAADSYSISVVINTDAKTLKFGIVPYMLNHVSDDYYHAYRTDSYGGDILVINRANGKFWEGGVTTLCNNEDCSDSFKAITYNKGDCRLAF